MKTFLPDYLVTSGEVLQDHLDSINLSVKKLSSRIGLPQETIDQIIHAKSPITPDIASLLEKHLGRPAHFWLKLEQDYQEDKCRLEEKK